MLTIGLCIILALVGLAAVLGVVLSCGVAVLWFGWKIALAIFCGWVVIKIVKHLFS